MVAVANRMTAWAKGSGGVPSGWIEVEWIKSTGTQYIDTGISGEYLRDNSISAIIDTKTPSSVTTQYAYGSCDSVWSNGFNMSVGNSDGRIRANWFGLNGEKVVDLGKRVVVANSRTYKIIDGETIRPIGTVKDNIDVNMFLFCDNRNGVSFSGYFWRQEVYSFVLAREDDSKILSLVGVKNVTTNEVAMCDILTGKIFSNAGSGAFVSGPDKT